MEGFDNTPKYLTSCPKLLNSFGNKMPPCRTPLVTLKTFEIEYPYLTDINWC